MNGILYIVSTPIGNLQDVTLRTVDVLGKVEYLICEDTRRAGLLLQSLKIQQKPRLISYYEQNELQRIPGIIQLLQNGSSVALISDGGTPLISDPGFKLVRECLKNNIKVESVPGPTALISALVVSGLPTDKFLFLGFLPKKQGHRKKLLNNLTSILYRIKVTVIIYEAPHRIVQLLSEIEQVFGDIEVVIARELTKVHEEIRYELISSSTEHFKKVAPKGEFVILFKYGNR